MGSATVNDRLKAARGDRTLREVAASIGITPSALSNYESGIRVPRDRIKVKLAGYYGVTIDSLFLKTILTKCEKNARCIYTFGRGIDIPLPNKP